MEIKLVMLWIIIKLIIVRGIYFNIELLVLLKLLLSKGFSNDSIKVLLVVLRINVIVVIIRLVL